ncbi:chloramphenicol phosphotransferase CPT [Tenggerimyces flavus]|uniref:Chloramphenicol phosphotransferase CPT n=1 Tax=Tenggerimyces flavus TaxID=1708749 RepID=A0ABV7YBS9_9ACTN|nr:chloramphenicol phosphotransferase CPT [Tenggerimyces flavus]MBM7783507.1 chloramphenicol 3-O phosphotransferase [Tenggerimyces flavus]
MTTQVIVLNGGSSSGKTSLSRRLQEVLPTPWLALGVDDLIDAMPLSMQSSDGDGIEFGSDGSVNVGPAFRTLEAAWMAGVATMARAGAPVIIDEVFLGGVAGRDRWAAALSGLSILWVGVRCDPEVAAAREALRGDRVTGMAAYQAEIVHEGMTYDVEVDTSSTDALTCARTIAASVR